MKSDKLSNEERQEFLKRMNEGTNKKIVEKIVSKKIVDMPKVEQPDKIKKELLVNQDNYISNSKKVGQGEECENQKGLENEKKIAEKVNGSVMAYKEQKVGKNNINGEQNSPNHNNMVANCPLPDGTVIVHQLNNNQEQRYILRGKPKKGGFGMTYTATYPGEDEECKVVIKEFYPRNSERDINTNTIHFNGDDTDLWKENFRNEPGRINRLKNNNPNDINKLNLVITKTNVFEDKNNSNLYYVMEYVNGHSLIDILYSFKDDEEAWKILPIDCRFQIMVQLCNAIKNLHSIPCIHQDISPNNILVDFDSEDNIQLKVIDYGLATNLYAGQEGSISKFKAAGTHGFSDIFTREAEYRILYLENRTDKLKLIDIYSLGAILGCLFLTNIQFIKNKEFASYYEVALQNNSLFQEIEINEKDTDKEIAVKLQINLIKKLVHDATIQSLDKRIQTVEDFRKRLDDIINTNEEWVAKYRKESFIQFWSESVDSFSKEIEERGKEISKNVKQHKNALAVWENANEHLKKAKKETEEIRKKTTDKELDENYNKISIINSEYENARIEFEKAKTIVEDKTLNDEDLIDNPADDKVKEDTKINKSESDTDIKTEEKPVTLEPGGNKFKTLLLGLVIGIILSVGVYFVYEKINESFTGPKSPFAEEIEYINNWFKDTDSTSKALTSRCEKLTGCLAEESWGKAYDSLAVANNIRNEIDDIDLYKADSVTLDEIIQKTKVADSHYKKSEIFLDIVDLTTETNELFIKARTDRNAIQEIKNKFSRLHSYIALKEGSSKPQTITESFDIFFGPVYQKEYIIGETHNITKVTVDNKNKQVLIVLEKIN